MRPWSERNSELAALFNPAFCSLILYGGVTHHQKQDERGMPLPVAFLLLPIILSANLRSALPSTARTTFHLWLDREPHVKIRLAKRAANLAPITREGLLFLLQRKRLLLSGERLQKGKIIKGLTTFADATQGLPDLLEGARILGTMLGKVDDVVTIFTSLGLTV